MMLHIARCMPSGRASGRGLFRGKTVVCDRVPKGPGALLTPVIRGLDPLAKFSFSTWVSNAMAVKVGCHSQGAADFDFSISAARWSRRGGPSLSPGGVYAPRPEYL